MTGGSGARSGCGCGMRLQPVRASAAPKAPSHDGLCRMRGLTARGADGLAQRQTDAEMRARVLAVHDLDGARVRVHELDHDGQADASALDMAALGRAPLIERFENSAALL